jgi:hypothetical protein
MLNILLRPACAFKDFVNMKKVAIRSVTALTSCHPPHSPFLPLIEKDCISNSMQFVVFLESWHGCRRNDFRIAHISDSAPLDV